MAKLWQNISRFPFRSLPQVRSSARQECDQVDGASTSFLLLTLVSARELMIEFQNILPRALKERGLALTDMASDKESERRLVRSMPSTEVSIAIKTAWHRNRDKQWSANDIYDIDALALAVPYCDIVVTEKACQHVLQASHLGETHAYRTPSEPR